ncbi:SET and MYND domain-containing protein 5 [Geranomyces variabilis]|uniref:SET and MYND domain-containing protein 5 n=1 Tax=Geranomyces variabilis TaxID=109894 RepID=A0AAD5XUG1_9FUNG|nr:SET and MYND domain-containing protein 5 [Geranomyces variabilis]
MASSSSSSSSSAPLTPAQRNLLSYFTPSNDALFHGDEAAATTAYYDALTQPFPAVSVKYINALRGKTVVATRDVEGGQVMFTDAPILAMRDFDSESTILICETCYTPLGTAADQLAHILDRAPTAAELALLSPSSDAAKPPSADFLRCECGTAAFCGPKCRSDAPHFLLCPAASTDDAALAAFKHHAAHTNDVFYLALVFYARVKADIIKHALTAAASSSSTTSTSTSPATSTTTASLESTYAIPHPLRTALAPFRPIAKRPWWDVLQPLPTDDDYEPPAQFRAQLEEVLRESLALLRDVVLGSDNKKTDATVVEAMMESILTTEFYALVVGMFEMNNLGAEIESPILAEEEFSSSCPELAALVRNALLSTNDESDNHLHHHDDDDNDFSSDDGDDSSLSSPPTQPHLQADLALLLPLHSVLNHSCEPNAMVGFSHGRATITAVRGIKAGEEICADYVHGERGAARREAIRKWGAEMVCRVGECVVCDEEVDDDDEGEDEEEQDEE